MTMHGFITALFFLAAIGFTIASMIVFEQLRDAVNEKLPLAEKMTRLAMMRRRESALKMIAIYDRYYPNGNLARLYQVCQGFTALTYAGAAVCLAILNRH